MNLSAVEFSNPHAKVFVLFASFVVKMIPLLGLRLSDALGRSSGSW